MLHSARRPCRLPSLLASLALALLPASGALFAHGDVDVDDFQLHLDDYEAEVLELSADVDALVADALAGAATGAALEALIDHWEEVGVHAAIESKSPPLYPGIWQALIAFREAVAGDAGESALAERADAVRAALWQGLGGVKLAASQVADGAAATADPGSEPAAAAATIAAIGEALDAAAAAYAEGDLDRAESLIHDAYMNRFEGLEGALIAEDAALVSDLEEAFNARLPLLMQRGADLETVRAEVRAIRESLARAGVLLREAAGERSEVF